MPSQHIGVQSDGVVGLPPVQDQPKILSVQMELHLSEFDYPPSSQNSSGEITFESPHIV